MSAIKISRRVHFPVETPRQSAQITGTNYVSKDRPVIVETIAIGDRDSACNPDGTGFLRRSEDNGKTWEIIERLSTEEKLEEDLLAVTTLPNVVYCDHVNGRAVRFQQTFLDKPSVYAWIYAEHPMWRHMRPHYQVSNDEGRTWSKTRPVVLSRDGFDQTHWMPGIWEGKNGGLLCPGGHIVTGKDGKMIVTMDSNRLFANGDICDPDADPAKTSPDGPVMWEASCIHARWRDDGTIDWYEAGEKMSLPKAYSCDGSEEPSVATMADGRLFMAIRARTFPHTGQALPSLHYYAVSDDEGLTWHAPQPLLYDDDSYAYSPACFITPIHSAKNDRLYIITNFADRPCVNCDPRNRLFIAEVDTNTFRIRKDTLTVIEQRDEADNIRFSNWRYYQDRATGDLAVFMTPATPEAVKLSDDVLPQVYRYDIVLPQ